MGYVEGGPPDELASALARAQAAEAEVKALDETKNAILSGLSHELRTPLTSIMGFAQILRDRFDELERTQILEFLDRLVHNAHRLDRLLGDMLDLDRLKRGILTPVRRPTDVAQLVADTADFTAPTDRRVQLDVERLIAEVDPSMLERIIENLLSNAFKHTETSATITAWVRATPDGILVGVDDTGDGLTDVQKHSVFHAFDRGGGSPTAAAGTGIGLTLVQRFSELHGGRAWAQDRDGVPGVSFRAFLPAHVRSYSTATDLGSAHEAARGPAASTIERP